MFAGCVNDDDAVANLETETIEKIVQEGLKLKKKCKTLRVLLLETETKRDQELKTFEVRLAQTRQQHESTIAQLNGQHYLERAQITEQYVIQLEEAHRNVLFCREEMDRQQVLLGDLTEQLQSLQSLQSPGSAQNSSSPLHSNYNNGATGQLYSSPPMHLRVTGTRRKWDDNYNNNNKASKSIISVASGPDTCLFQEFVESATSPIGTYEHAVSTNTTDTNASSTLFDLSTSYGESTDYTAPSNNKAAMINSCSKSATAAIDYYRLLHVSSPTRSTSSAPLSPEAAPPCNTSSATTAATAAATATATTATAAAPHNVVSVVAKVDVATSPIKGSKVHNDDDDDVDDNGANNVLNVLQLKLRDREAQCSASKQYSLLLQQENTDLRHTVAILQVKVCDGAQKLSELAQCKQSVDEAVQSVLQENHRLTTAITSTSTSTSMSMPTALVGCLHSNTLWTESSPINASGIAAVDCSAPAASSSASAASSSSSVSSTSRVRRSKSPPPKHHHRSVASTRTADDNIGSNRADIAITSSGARSDTCSGTINGKTTSKGIGVSLTSPTEKKEVSASSKPASPIMHVYCPPDSRDSQCHTRSTDDDTGDSSANNIITNNSRKNHFSSHSSSSSSSSAEAARQQSQRKQEQQKNNSDYAPNHRHNSSNNKGESVLSAAKEQPNDINKVNSFSTNGSNSSSTSISTSSSIPSSNKLPLLPLAAQYELLERELDDKLRELHLMQDTAETRKQDKQHSMQQHQVRIRTTAPPPPSTSTSTASSSSSSSSSRGGLVPDLPEPAANTLLQTHEAKEDDDSASIFTAVNDDATTSGSQRSSLGSTVRSTDAAAAASVVSNVKFTNNRSAYHSETNPTLAAGKALKAVRLTEQELISSSSSSSSGANSSSAAGIIDNNIEMIADIVSPAKGKGIGGFFLTGDSTATGRKKITSSSSSSSFSSTHIASFLVNSSDTGTGSPTVDDSGGGGGCDEMAYTFGQGKGGHNLTMMGANTTSSSNRNNITSSSSSSSRKTAAASVVAAQSIVSCANNSTNSIGSIGSNVRGIRCAEGGEGIVSLPSSAIPLLGLVVGGRTAGSCNSPIRRKTTGGPGGGGSHPLKTPTTTTTTTATATL